MKTFISYRRADSRYVVDRIWDRLISAHGDETIFRDIETIPLGGNFNNVLNKVTSIYNEYDAGGDRVCRAACFSIAMLPQYDIMSLISGTLSTPTRNSKNKEAFQ